MMCDARQYSDQMLCDTCGLQWDVKDPDPPQCKPPKPPSPQALARKATQADGGEWVLSFKSLDALNAAAKLIENAKKGDYVLRDR